MLMTARRIIMVGANNKNRLVLDPAISNRLQYPPDTGVDQRNILPQLRATSSNFCRQDATPDACASVVMACK